MVTRKRVRQLAWRAALIGWLLSLALLGCYRSPPPEVPEFRAPPEKGVKETAAPEVAETASEGAIEEPLPPEPEMEPEPVEAVPAGPPPVEPPPQPETRKEALQGPTIIGTWRVTNMLVGGQSQTPPGNMEVTFTFAEDGTLTTSMSGDSIPEPQSTHGTFTLDGNQITISMENEVKTGTYTLDRDTLTLTFDEVQMVLTP